MPSPAGALDKRLLVPAVETSVDGILVTDRTGAVESVNPAFTTITGYIADEVIGRNLRFLKSGQQPPEFYAELWRTITAGRSWHGEIVNRRKDGSLYPQELGITPVLDKHSKVSHFIAVQHDISVRKQAERDLERSRMRLELGLEVTHQGLWDWNVETDTSYRSPQYHRMLGYEPGEIGNDESAWRDMLHPEDAAAVLQTIQDYLNGKLKTLELDFRLRKKSGAYVRVFSQGEIVSRNESGRPERVIGIHTDMTELARHQQQLRQAQQMEAVGLLAGGIAHDFNNTLTVINGYSDLIAASNSTLGNAREFAGLIRRAGAAAAELVGQLMAFSQTQLSEPRILDVNTTIAEMERMLQRLLPKNIDITTHLDASLGSVFADPGQVHQMLMNLVVNARDAMPHGGQLKIETSNAEIDRPLPCSHRSIPPGEYVVIAVSDTGTGMDERTKAHLFEPFFTTKAFGAGTGMGLSTVYGLVMQNRGWIRMDSERGKGSAFQIYLPRVRGKAPATPVSHPVPSAGGNETILLVEDSTDVRQFLSKALASYGYSVLQAGSATEAATVFEQSRDTVDLLITDVILPGANGREIAESMRLVRRDIAVLFVSGYTGDVILKGGVLQHSSSFLQKPFSAAVLAQRVREILLQQKQSKRILVVDDDPGVLGLMARFLSDGGYKVVTAENGKQAMDLVRESPVDVVITDLVMPEQEGLETILKLRATNPPPLIIAISGAFGGEFLTAARAMGAKATLLKPITADNLLSTVRQVLRTAAPR